MIILVLKLNTYFFFREVFILLLSFTKKGTKISISNRVSKYVCDFKFQKFFLQFDLVLSTFTREARKSSSSSSSSLDLQKRYYRKHILLIFKASQIHYISGRLIQI